MFRAIHVDLIEVINKLSLLHLVGCLYYCITDTWSLKHQCFLHLHSLNTDKTHTLQHMEFDLDAFDFMMRRRNDIK